MRIAWAVLALCALAPQASAQEPFVPDFQAPVPAEATPTVAGTYAATVDDPLAVKSAAEGWVWAQRYWSPPAEPKDLAGGRIQALIGAGRWGFAFRGDVSGMPGEFAPDKPETFRTVEGHVAVHRNVARTDDVTLGVTAGVGAGLSLEQRDGAPPKTPQVATAGLGLRVSGPGWWVYAVYGMHQALPGSAAVFVYQVRTTDRTAAVGTFAVGASGSYVAQFGVAVRWF